MVATLTTATDRRPVARHLTLVGPPRQEAFGERAARRAAPSVVPSPTPRQGPALDRRSPAVTGRRSSAVTGRRRHAPEVYRRRRIVAFGLLAFTILGLWVAVQGLIGTSSGSLGATRPIASHQVVVRPGDTLWSIALASGVHGDVRPLVDQLSAEVHGRPLQVGELISIP